MENPPPLPQPAPYTCHHCGVPIYERVPFCPQCGAPVEGPIPSPTQWRGGPPQSGCFKAFAASALIITALVVGSFGACIALISSSEGGMDGVTLAIVAVCALVVVGCIAGLVKTFKKPER